MAVPLTRGRLRKFRVLTGEGLMVNVTLFLPQNQALLAVRAGTIPVSAPAGRVGDLALDGMTLIADIRRIYNTCGYRPRVVANSVHAPGQLKRAALTGADVATAPPTVIKAMANHALTYKGLDAAAPDRAKKTGKIP
ncbi:transaldolase family protein [Tropicimonas sp.]|uniref:transaldolase family protein n=1 Tax=Tropicimonas sp. TaxID=2067044 RepID=UPI003A88B8A8